MNRQRESNITVNGDIVGTNNSGTHSDELIGELKIPGARLWNHRIVFEGNSTIKCEECEMEEEIPELFRLSGGHREVAYRLYIMAKFKNEKCRKALLTSDGIDGIMDRTTITKPGDRGGLRDGGIYWSNTWKQ